ncbi:D-xylose transporter subunit XylF [Sporotomaculum syntrophicum]|uniref:D-xylose transporter subunit XylF n=1 Tax=Sporotomaculum syntrophicum TaxID=182264 RepID=A0A9D2WT32_9FIRM|nr:substrate-binding domain-containing protein [Sporotomaculum syntrophicum]KAF1086122.1 D-xylose transporter subunit XylF [Sporotomaculum syntrophicum]
MGGLRCLGWLKQTSALLVIAVLLVLPLFSTGCGNQEAQRKPAEAPLKIAFAVADLNRDGNKTIKKIVDEQKKQANADIIWLDAKNDAGEQQKQLSGLADKKIKAVVLQPADPGAAQAMVENLARSGIKVVALESLPVNTPLEGYIASEHAMVGRLQARYVLEALRRSAETREDSQFTLPKAGTIIRPGEAESEPAQEGQTSLANESGQSRTTSSGQGLVSGVVDYTVVAQLPTKRPLNLVILQGDPRDQTARDITAANQAALQGQEEISIVEVFAHPRWDPITVPANLAEAMNKHGRIDVILANDSTLAMAAVEFLKMGGYEKSVLTVGAGADEKASQALVRGEHDAEVDLQPEMLGRFALEAAAGLAKTGYWQYGEKVNNGDYSVPARIVPARLITAKNAYLLEERWKELKKAREKEGGQQQEQARPPGEEQSGGQEQGDQQGQQGQQGEQSQPGQQGKTTLRITTQDGKTMEVQIEGEVKKIESSQGGQQGYGQGSGDNRPEEQSQ